MSEEYTYHRAHGLKTRLLTREDYQKLLQTKTLEEVIDYLIKINYDEELSKLPREELTVPRIEKVLMQNWVNHVYLLYSTATVGELRNLIYSYARVFEVENLKKIILWKAKRKPFRKEDLQYLIPIPRRLATINFEALAKTRDLKQLIDYLELTIYGENLKNALEKYEETKQVLFFEKALEESYREVMFKTTLRLSGTEKELTERYYKTRFILKNLMVIFVLKSAGYTQKEIRELIIPFRGDELLKKVLKAKTTQESLKILSSAKYWKMMETAAEEYEKTREIGFIEDTVTRALENLAIELMEKDYFGIGFLFGYLILKEIEIQNLVKIINSKARGLSVKEKIIF